MKIVNSGNSYEVFDDSLVTYDSLPSQTYTVRFSKLRGFFLEKTPNMVITEDKVYGVHLSKVDKVINSFKAFNRNLGVILSGDKGIGKSLFAKLLSLKAIESGIPLIIVDQFIPGISSYIEGIEQEVMVLFDEFDKTFKSSGEENPQDTMLSLFDGTSHGKKLFVITCNELRELNDFLVNRPGRFHYHFRFEYPTPAEIAEYLTDKLNPEYYKEIDKVVSFSGKVKINYDCLRAIAFEINSGLSFENAIMDLNIVNTELCSHYNISLEFDNGYTLRRKGFPVDMFSDDEICICFEDEQCYDIVRVYLNPDNIIYDIDSQVHFADINKVRLSFEDYGECYEEQTKLINSLRKAKVSSLKMIKVRDKSLHYLV